MAVIKRKSLRGKTLRLCGAAEAGDASAKRRLKTLVDAQPFDRRILREFIDSESLQNQFKHEKCPWCPVVLPSEKLEKHVLQCGVKTAPKPKKKKSVQQRTAVTIGKATPTKKRLRIKRTWVDIHSTRSSRVSGSGHSCDRCQTKRGQLWQYDSTSVGPLVLCEKCKRLASQGGKAKKTKRKKKLGGDAMTRTYPGGGFETNRRRH